MKPLMKPAAPSTLTPYEQLDAVLRQLVIEHEKLLTQAGQHRRAIAQADAAALGASMEAQQVLAQRIVVLERQRQEVVATLTRTDPKSVRFVDVAARAPEPMRSRLTGVVKTLREVLNALHQEHIALRQAAETLSMHMEGLLRQVCRGISHTGTYARRGAMDTSVQVVSSMDVRS